MKTIDDLLKTHKECKKCKIYFTFDNFHKDKKQSDGLYYYCKQCNIDNIISYEKKMRSNSETHNVIKERKRIQYEQDMKRPEYVEKKNENNKKHKPSLEKSREYSAAQRLRDKEKCRARLLVSSAIKSGKLVRLPCEVCGDPKSEGHHDDYMKPLQVRWLCRSHHAEHHRKYPQQ